MLAVLAEDYVRNLNEEREKGFNGRLKQGLYPLKAPIGYLDNGGGKPKTICPERGPHIKSMFDYTRQGNTLWKCYPMKCTRADCAVNMAGAFISPKLTAS